MQSLFDIESPTVDVRAVYFRGLLDLKAFRAAHPHLPALMADPLAIEVVRGQYAVLTKFGSVVFWNCAEAHVAEICAAVAALPSAGGPGGGRDERIQERMRVRLGAPEPPAAADAFHEVALNGASLDKLKVVSLAIGQSVALEHFELALNEVLREVLPRVEALRTRGKLLGAHGDVLRDVGFVLAVRAQVLANLTLFDQPPEAWDSPAIERLSNLLYDHFDLEERLSAINQKVAFLNDLNTTFLTVLNHRKSLRLEIVVVALFVVDVAVVLWEFFTRAAHAGQ